MTSAVNGHVIIFTNDVQENPIGEFNAFYIHQGKAPKGTAGLEYVLTSAIESDNSNIKNTEEYIKGRFTEDERNIMLALPKGASHEPCGLSDGNKLPFIQVIIPSDFRSIEDSIDSRGGFSFTWENINAGLDGIEIELPALNVRPTIDEYFPMNIQVKDPILPLRNLFDFSFSVIPNEARILWIDLRDKILPNDKPLFITIAGSGGDFNPMLLESTGIKLIFKPWPEAIKEHTEDRFPQVRDCYAMIVEERVKDRRLNLYNQFEDEMTDLLRVAPDHYPGRNYWYLYNTEQPEPTVTLRTPPDGIPMWAFLQIEDLKAYKKFVEWYIDKRQIEDGELGGGLSDDGDLSNWWPGLALMGVIPEKITKANEKILEAIYNNGMFTGGLPSIQTDGLHTYEEGTNVVCQVNLEEFGNPKQVERMLQIVHDLREKIIGINKAGHHHFRPNYYSATKIATEDVWAWSSAPECLNLQPSIYLAEFYSNGAAKKLILDVANGLLAHARKDSSGKIIIDTDINFNTDESRTSELGSAKNLSSGLNSMTNITQSASVIHIFWLAWRITNDSKYLKPLLDLNTNVLNIITSNMLDIVNLRNTWGEDIALGTSINSDIDFRKHITWQITGDKKFLESYYTNQIKQAVIREYINTEGSCWIDRVYVAEKELQRSRLGGVALSRNQIFPGNAVSWKFKEPAKGESVAILIPFSNPERIKIEAYNLEKFLSEADITGGDILPGRWEVIQGVDINNDGIPDKDVSNDTLTFERSKSLHFHFPPKQTYIISLRLVEKDLDYSRRPDLGKSIDDIKIDSKNIFVKVHNIGAIDSPPVIIVLMNQKNEILSKAQIPAIKAPFDLLPKTAEVVL